MPNILQGTVKTWYGIFNGEFLIAKSGGHESVFSRRSFAAGKQRDIVSNSSRFFSVNGAVFVPPCRPVSYDLLPVVPYAFETKKPLERVCTSTKFKRLKRQNCRSGN